ncbi:hypothetical protein [Spirosoma gilvum]
MANDEYKNWTLEELKNACKANNITVKAGSKRDAYIKRLREKESNGTGSLFQTKESTDIFSSTSYQFKQKNNELEASVYFLQLHLNNVADYFNAGMIYPLELEESEIYKNVNRQFDIINKYPDRIVVSKGITSSFDETQVLVGLFIKNEEYHPIKEAYAGYVEVPLPVSRVKYLYFATQSARDSFVASVKTFPDSYIPENICIVIPTNFKTIPIDLTYSEFPKKTESNPWRGKLKLFDKLLGLFSFMKNVGIMYADKENNLREYPLSYISALCELNTTSSLPKREDQVFRSVFLPDERIHFKIESQRYIFKQTLEAIFKDEVFSINLVISIIEKAVKQIVEKSDEQKELIDIINYIRQWENRRISYQSLLEIENIKKYLPILILIFLAKFPNKAQHHTDKQSVRIAIMENQKFISRNFAEYILAILGLYYGYRNMIKNDTNLRVNDDFFYQIANSVQSIKFKLDTYFERFTVETIYDFVCQGFPVLNDYLYITEMQLNPFSTSLNQLQNSPSGNSYNEKSSFILNTKIINFEKISRLDTILNVISEKYANELNSDSYLIHFFLKNIGMDKVKLIELIRLREKELSLDELESVIKLDLKKKK